MNPFPELNKTKVRSQCSNQLFNALKDSARKKKMSSALPGAIFSRAS